MKLLLTILFFCFSFIANAAQKPIPALLDRLSPGASKKIIVEMQKSDRDFFELDQKGGSVVVRGNNPVSIAVGLNWYLKYYAGVHISWNNMTASLPDVLPPVGQRERHETTDLLRYDFNYCTHSYSMAFWDWQRWEQEIDWMALHGVNMPLVVQGVDVVWRNVLRRLGYSDDDAKAFIAGPAFQAWWLMNNLEGWGGPLPDSWFDHSEQLARKMMKRMRELGIKPVLPGYSGMVPHDAKERLGLDVADPGLWCGYPRPAFLLPTDPRFAEIADIYYEEMNRLFGPTDYYSMDPFHEGGNTRGVDLAAAGQAIWKAMKKANPASAWVIQAWQGNPREEMISGLPAGDLVVLDLFAESKPQWGDPDVKGGRKNGFGHHNWLYCMLLNFGGNVGLHGKMQHLIDEYYKARSSAFGQTLSGVGMTMEGTENNPVMYELLMELPWRAEWFEKDEWLSHYVRARYGTTSAEAEAKVQEAWRLLAASVYNCPAENTQQGTVESIFCCRPSAEAWNVSSWSHMEQYYNASDVIAAARLMVEAAEGFEGNNNFEYDLIDIVRQAVAEKGRQVYTVMQAALKAGEVELFRQASFRFLSLLMEQDRLLATRPEFCLSTWTSRARSLGTCAEESDLYEWNARVQITTWGNRQASEAGGLHDYAHREWSGLLRDFYHPRWKAWIDSQLLALSTNTEPQQIDFYSLEQPWTLLHTLTPTQGNNPILAARRAIRML